VIWRKVKRRFLQWIALTGQVRQTLGDTSFSPSTILLQMMRPDLDTVRCSHGLALGSGPRKCLASDSSRIFFPSQRLEWK